MVFFRKTINSYLIVIFDAFLIFGTILPLSLIIQQLFIPALN